MASLVWFVVALGSACVFYILFYLTAMPVFRRHGIVPEMREGACFVNRDLNNLAQLLDSDSQPLTPYYALVVVRWVFIGSVLLLMLSSMRSCG